MRVRDAIWQLGCHAASTRCGSMLATDLPAARARAVRKGCACLGHESTPTRHAFYVSVRCMCSHWRYVERARLADVVICTCRPGRVCRKKLSCYCACRICQNESHDVLNGSVYLTLRLCTRVDGIQLALQRLKDGQFILQYPLLSLPRAGDFFPHPGGTAAG